jgi:hypothetical protein
MYSYSCIEDEGGGNIIYYTRKLFDETLQSAVESMLKTISMS